MDKYPRTYHFTFSPGCTNDDKKVSAAEELLFSQKSLVCTEKLDGGNTRIDATGVYARSASGPTNHESFDYLKAFQAIHKYRLRLMNLTIYGENLYAVHSIEYKNLPSYFFIFAIKERDLWLSWDEVKELAWCFELPTVPELAPIILPDSFDVKAHSLNVKDTVIKLAQEESYFGGPREGVVVRNAGRFRDFNTNVLKYVRANHVQTDQHWTKNWKKATLKGK